MNKNKMLIDNVQFYVRVSGRVVKFRCFNDSQVNNYERLVSFNFVDECETVNRLTLEADEFDYLLRRVNSSIKDGDNAQHIHIVSDEKRLDFRRDDRHYTLRVTEGYSNEITGFIKDWKNLLVAKKELRHICAH